MIRSGDATTCRTSPSRYSPVTTGAGPPYASASAAASSPIVCGSPLATLYGRSSPGIAVDVTARTFAAATSRTCTKSRRWPPSSNTRGASPRRSAEPKMLATPAYGVSLGIRGP